MDYATPERRKSKNDKRAKGRYARYKKGGSFRTMNIPSNREEGKH